MSNTNDRPSRQNDSIDVGRRKLLQMTGVSAAALGMMSFLDSPFAKAQDMSNAANNFYVSDKVTVQKVTFKTQYQINKTDYLKVAGNLFTPKTLDRSAKHSAIIVGHPMGAVKEQSANLYATKMAERGFLRYVGICDRYSITSGWRRSNEWIRSCFRGAPGSPGRPSA